MILKQAFVECSSNILETLLSDYWNLPKDQYLLLSNHTLLTQKQLFQLELFINSFSLKCSVMFSRCPEHCDTEGTLSVTMFPEYRVPAGLDPNYGAQP